MRSTLRYFNNVPPTEAELARKLHSHGVGKNIEGKGLSAPHVAFLLRCLTRRKIQVYLHPASLRELGRHGASCQLPTRERTKSLKILNPDWARGVISTITKLQSDGVVIKVGRYGLDHITSVATDAVTIVRVNCAEYYNLPLNDEAHFLTLLPKKNVLVVCDSYELNGYQEIPRWKRHLAKAAAFDWSTWQGDAVVVNGLITA